LPLTKGETLYEQTFNEEVKAGWGKKEKKKLQYEYYLGRFFPSVRTYRSKKGHGLSLSIVVVVFGMQYLNWKLESSYQDL
jgi:hypothetical protein